jgi:hydroxymethylpyrimidine pyrophosphatase-like HAD family hydrolase
MVETLNAVAAKGHHLGIVSGSDEKKVTDQVKQAFIDQCEYVFFENGLQAVKNGKTFAV